MYIIFRFLFLLNGVFQLYYEYKSDFNFSEVYERFIKILQKKNELCNDCHNYWFVPDDNRQVEIKSNKNELEWLSLNTKIQNNLEYMGLIE